jgi:DNA-binding response OmpR family regulator
MTVLSGVAHAPLNRPLVALVDDDGAHNDRLAATLEAEGFDCVAFDAPDPFLAASRRSTFDAVVLDWNMPELTGLDVVRELRRTVPDRLPVLMVTVRDSFDEIVEGLEAGVDDYAAKPIPDKVIAARLRALLRRCCGVSDLDVEAYGPVSFRLSTGQAKLHGEEVDLTIREFHLARLFFRNLGRPLSRDYLGQKVWGYRNGVETRTLDSHVSRLRRKLMLRPERGYRLAMVYGYGYRLDAVDLSEWPDAL